MKRVFTLQAVWVWGLMAAVGPARVSWADCGSIPFTSGVTGSGMELVGMGLTAVQFGANELIEGPPARRVQVNFDPLKVTVFEPRQRAIILWNGEEEILLLSTDQKASEASWILEVIPLPGRPEVRLGSFETFEKAQRLAVEKRMWACAHGGARAGIAQLPESAGRIDFVRRLGAHDIAVAEVLNRKGFVDFVQGYLRERYQVDKAPIREEFVKIIESYLDEGFSWFAFDAINLMDKTQSRQPIEYRFKTDSVFYPLRISTLEQGKTEVDLLVFTPGGARNFTGLAMNRVGLKPLIEVSRGEVEGLAPGWEEFFGQRSRVVMDQWSLEGPTTSFLTDIRVK